jgi:hypothetical protein
LRSSSSPAKSASSLEQNQRDNDVRRRAQASRVFIAAPRDEGRQAIAHARNTSALPVYSVRIRYGTPSGGMTEPEYLATIMPGESAPAGRLFDEPDEALRLAVLTFRDAAGIEWIRTPDGELWEPSPMREDPRELAEFKLSTPDGPGVGDSLAIDTLLNAWKSSPRRASRRAPMKHRRTAGALH